jgi:hypothetical protein
MLASSPMEGLRQVCRVRVAVLCVLFGLWCFVPVAGAELIEACCGSGGSMVGATAAAWGAPGNGAMVMAAGDMLARTVIPDGGAQVMAGTNSEANSIARERRRRAGPQLSIPLRPKPALSPKPSPVR